MSVQQQILSRFMALSNGLDLSLNVHFRSTGYYMIALLKDYQARYVLLMHLTARLDGPGGR